MSSTLLMFLTVRSRIRRSRSLESDSRRQPILMLLVGFSRFSSASPASRPNPENQIYTTALDSPSGSLLSLPIGLSPHPDSNRDGTVCPPPPPLSLAYLSPPFFPPLPSWCYSRHEATSYTYTCCKLVTCLLLLLIWFRFCFRN
jgi:hypothetical protein